MKKIMTIIMTFCLIAGLTACSGDTNDTEVIVLILTSTLISVVKQVYVNWNEK